VALQAVGKIAVVGAAGGIGQPLSMLLKLNVAPDVLALYDVSPAAPGVAADVSHVDSKGQVRQRVNAVFSRLP
jgi:malate/lactate dehydrogenase